MALLPENLSFPRKILPVLAGVGLLIAVFVIFSNQPDRSDTDPNQQPPSAQGDLANQARVAGAGIVEPSSELISIGSALSGLVTDVRVTPGQYVSKGEPLFLVDDRAIRARLREANAAIAEARASITNAQTQRDTAQRQLNLYQGLDDPAAVSQSEVIRAEGDAAAAQSLLQVARARLSAAQASASSARTELDRLTVRAPISGEILAVNVRPGEFVSTQGGSGNFIEMGETRPLHVRIDIDENEIARVNQGATAFVSPRGDAANQVEARYVRTEPLVIPKRSLTNTAAERVDVRVMQLIYALPQDARSLFAVGQQVDGFIPAVGNGNDGKAGDTGTAQSDEALR
jgi:RND family efflux transporter MFP subunit